jgi:hypothetical protein
MAPEGRAIGANRWLSDRRRSHLCRYIQGRALRAQEALSAQVNEGGTDCPAARLPRYTHSTGKTPSAPCMGAPAGRCPWIVCIAIRPLPLAQPGRSQRPHNEGSGDVKVYSFSPSSSPDHSEAPMPAVGPSHTMQFGKSKPRRLGPGTWKMCPQSAHMYCQWRSLMAQRRPCTSVSDGCAVFAASSLRISKLPFHATCGLMKYTAMPRP